ncbi:hypothetical protein MTR67_044703 [Solanum verrucosum]|uniref:Uncharacterized protein n=1 Tax=Solanum verrucosum TaxID=315347 RepID=A0AAF0ZVI1_SOLVR|nr:hypothetical protein MTR67_044703 [Solanum verrucosum]
MAGTPPLTRCFVHPDVSPSFTATPNATPNDTMPALAPGQKDRLGRVMIEPDGSSWHPIKDAARDLKVCVRRLYTQAYHSWSEIPNSIRQAMFNNFKTMCNWESSNGTQTSLRQYQSLKGDSLHTGGAKTVGTIARDMDALPLNQPVFKKTHVRKKENELDPDVWVEERAERTFSGLEGIGSSRQAEALDGVHITTMSDQIAKLTVGLAESERRRVAEQERMSEIV